jgi:23S rRNA (uracil1939-C5)-methyltransferase
MSDKDKYGLSRREKMEFQRGDRIQVRIADVAFGGDGVARVSDFVIFIPMAVDGDEMEIEITDIRKKYGRGRMVRLLKPSSHRVSPNCPWYARCGGCSLQHVSYAHQLEIKKKQIEEAFRRVAGIAEPPVLFPIGSPQSFGWRGKAEFHYLPRHGKTGQLGLMAAHSNDIVEIDRCLIVAESVNSQYMRLKKDIQNGTVRSQSRRLVVWSDEVGEPPNTIFTRSKGVPDISRTVLGKRMIVPGDGFFQANTLLTARLVEEVVKLAAPSGNQTVLDLYAGVGLFSLFLADKAGRLFCIEGDKDAARCARMNLKRHELHDAICYHGDVGEVLENEFLDPARKVDSVILDPPRDGCAKEALATIVKLRPGRIVYISCNPQTQTRDVKILVEKGYRLQSVQPLDMFPQTHHVEAVALLTEDEMVEKRD